MAIALVTYPPRGAHEFRHCGDADEWDLKQTRSGRGNAGLSARAAAEEARLFCRHGCRVSVSGRFQSKAVNVGGFGTAIRITGSSEDGS